MNKPFTVACIQNCATNDTNTSMAECIDLCKSAKDKGATFIFTPEFCGHLYVEGKNFSTDPKPENQHSALHSFQALATELDIWLCIGSLAVADPDGNLRNRSFVINSNGAIGSRYDKIHMFDVTLSDGEIYRESDTFTPGEQAVIATTPFSEIGLSICYDLRFASLYRLLAQNGATILTVPAAFTHTTGKAHWHVLLRSRAIETGCFVIAACQYGYHGSAHTYGHSLIIDPWGKILAEGGEEQDIIIADIDLQHVNNARSRIPALIHDRPIKLS